MRSIIVIPVVGSATDTDRMLHDLLEVSIRSMPYLSFMVAAWLTGNAIAHTNEVALRPAGLVHCKRSMVL